MATHIETIQRHEKEKLLIYAAKHMDELQAGSDLLKPHLDTTPQTEYNATSLNNLEVLITEALDCVRSDKVDLLESSSEQGI